METARLKIYTPHLLIGRNRQLPKKNHRLHDIIMIMLETQIPIGDDLAGGFLS